MSRTKKQSTELIEELKAEIRSLKQVNKSLTRQLKKINEEVEPVLREPTKEELEERNNRCPKCQQLWFSKTHLGPKILLVCHCGNKKTEKTKG